MTKPDLPPLSESRSPDQIRNHYEVEKEIALRLKNATREERRLIYPTMYDELFERVPDHPRLQIRDDDRRTARHNRQKWPLVRPFLNPSTVFVEFAPGSCRFSFEVCPLVETVYGIDISDQTGDHDLPGNFKLIIYNGYELDMDDEFADVVFSDQLLEHFHPEDTELHLDLVRRMLKPGGRYVFRTPHRFSGPHDVSVGFAEDEPEGFHLKEWTYGEFDTVLREIGYRSWAAYRITKGKLIPVPMNVLIALEKVVGGMSRKYRVPIARRLFKNIALSVLK